MNTDNAQEVALLALIRVHPCASVAHGVPPCFETRTELDTFIKWESVNGEKKGKQTSPAVRGGLSAGCRRADEALRGHRQAGRRARREPRRALSVEAQE